MRSPVQHPNVISGVCRWTAGAAMTFVVLSLLAVVTTPFAQAQKFKTLHTFTGPIDGATPYSVMIGTDGAVYGTASNGGDLNVDCGTLFKLNGHQFSVLHTFEGGDGCGPGGVIQDASGTLYGVTNSGGDGVCHARPNPPGCGVVYKLDKKGHEQILHFFTGTDGEYGVDRLLQDGAGNLYGVTWWGDNGWKEDGYGWGGVYELSKSNKETVLHAFTGGTDGGSPSGGLTADNAGNLYGTTWGSLFCEPNCGTVFKLDLRRQKLTTLYAFAPNNGGEPQGGVVMDANGNLYGAATFQNYCGTVYKLTPKRKLTVLHAFTGKNDGCAPRTNLILDSAGNLYGTASSRGRYGAGTLFKVTKSGTFTVLHAFNGTSDGSTPQGRIVSDKGGNIYGPTSFGGNSQWCHSGCGTIWELTP